MTGSGIGGGLAYICNKGCCIYAHALSSFTARSAGMSSLRASTSSLLHASNRQPLEYIESPVWP